MLLLAPPCAATVTLAAEAWSAPAWYTAVWLGGVLLSIAVIVGMFWEQLRVLGRGSTDLGHEGRAAGPRRDGSGERSGDT